jgi:hypothetical protein
VEQLPPGRETPRSARGADRLGHAGEVTEGTVIATPVGETPCLFLAGLFHAERGIAERVRTLLSGPLPWPEIDAARPCPGSRSARA